ncbi:MAG: type II toxin-antitoxin system PemK/MazF family toxin [Candidatus Moeniiplasma glomeromycotorum]|nr:type II toxin-antitoxin system PemK/MazF family toxin [Candidatus Moeniiplasma glomeromycotorum]MCE8167571.1 type II toxin-antitoxin system PemK/MazF family toxin [Candidatus Moeniiplasma glomeromycotorum]MCE8169077.1 type II toxin-antitoxin system PemK/MazF family toxin [Candidatus Moeniiplasma glomeromycotorum]
MSSKIIKRGEIYWADLTDEEEVRPKRDKIGKIRKKKSQKDRPVVVISNDKQNKYSDDIIVTLISSQIDKVYYFEPEISLKKKSKILTDQILTMDKERLGEKIASLSPNEIMKLEKALHVVLSLRTWCRQKYGGFTSETCQLLQLLVQKEGISANQLL